MVRSEGPKTQMGKKEQPMPHLHAISRPYRLPKTLTTKMPTALEKLWVGVKPLVTPIIHCISRHDDDYYNGPFLPFTMIDDDQENYVQGDKRELLDVYIPPINQPLHVVGGIGFGVH